MYVFTSTRISCIIANAGGVAGFMPDAITGREYLIELKAQKNGNTVGYREFSGFQTKIITFCRKNLHGCKFCRTFARFLRKDGGVVDRGGLENR